MMLSYPATDERLSYEGAPGLRKRADGTVEVRRIPLAYRAQIPNPIMQLVTDTSAGARILFHSAANRIEVQFSCHQIATEAAPSPSTGMQLLRGDVVRTHASTQPLARLHPVDRSVSYDPPRVSTAVFDELGHQDGEVEILLPNGAVIDIVQIRADDEIRSSGAVSAPRWVHHGSSISHCSTALEPLDSWPVIAARGLGLSLCNLGFAGNAMLDPFVARTIRDTDADVISLKIGINLINADAMTLRAFTPALHGFLDTIREGQPTTPILLISPIACSAHEDSPGPTIVDTRSGTASAVPLDAIREPAALTLSRIRTAMEAIAQVRQQDDKRLTYLDGRTLFSETDEIAGHLEDGLHPDLEGCRLMGERFIAAYQRLCLPPAA
ncbi:SGNH/GDSL hydrolase family protein [Microbacterium saperdae]